MGKDDDSKALLYVGIGAVAAVGAGYLLWRFALDDQQRATVRHAVGDVLERGRKVASDGVHKARDVATEGVHRARDLAAAGAERARHAADAVSSKVRPARP